MNSWMFRHRSFCYRRGWCRCVVVHVVCRGCIGEKYLHSREGAFRPWSREVCRMKKGLTWIAMDFRTHFATSAYGHDSRASTAITLMP
ncbi:hypothetical protein PHSY_005103 [Pseudozyma hubeiensis SY62]|uniref:Uncharacterized protein n=1 Tax=Pseudozyma hubeiensis (strain SY62) TaxID=1305764 RepID=R9P8D5_PSEHS|nr:hypothetical protein PHSY_005103 [Pseudozyma hubeiensis SY62]GAC97517.1 hypothetical protein PHSY_005103 [Pseudozyma hubeiensis SY62]